MSGETLTPEGSEPDTAWFAMTDADWQAVKPACLVWLDPANFDENGHQRTKLATETR